MKDIFDERLPETNRDIVQLKHEISPGKTLESMKRSAFEEPSLLNYDDGPKLRASMEKCSSDMVSPFKASTDELISALRPLLSESLQLELATPSSKLTESVRKLEDRLGSDQLAKNTIMLASLNKCM